MAARGFTLLEVVLVIIILGILAAFIAPILSTALESYDHTARNLALSTNMRYSIERMAREIRTVRRDPANSANYDIPSIGSTSKLDLCRADGTRVSIERPAAANTEIRLDYATGFSSTCTATAANSTVRTLTDGVTAFTFAYLQNDGTTPATNTANLAFIDIDMTLAGRTTDGSTPTLRSVVRVYLRNPCIAVSTNAASRF